MIKLKSLKKLSVLFVVFQIISISSINAQIQSPSDTLEKLDRLKSSLNEVTIMDLSGVVKMSEYVKGFENEQFLSLDEFQSKIQTKEKESKARDQDLESQIQNTSVTSDYDI